MHFTPSAAPDQIAESDWKWRAYKFLNGRGALIDINQYFIDYP